MSTGSRSLGGSASSILEYYKTELEDVGMEFGRSYSKYHGSSAEQATDVAFNEVWGTAAARMNISTLTEAQFLDLCNGIWTETLADGELRVWQAKNNGRRVINDLPAIKRITEQLLDAQATVQAKTIMEKDLLSFEVAFQIARSSITDEQVKQAKMLARTDLEAKAKVVNPKDTPTTAYDALVFEMLLMDYKESGARNYKALAKKDARATVRLIIDPDMAPTKRLDQGRVDVLTEHLIETRGLSREIAREVALTDERAFVNDQPPARYERDQDRFVQLVSKFLGAGMEASAATQRAFFHPDVITGKYVSPPKDGPRWEKDKGRTRQLVTRFESEGLTNSEAIAKAENDPRALIKVVESPVRKPVIDVFLSPDKSVDELLIWAIDNGHFDLAEKIIGAWVRSMAVGAQSMEERAQVARVSVETPSQRADNAIGLETFQEGSRTKNVAAEMIIVPVVQFAARPTDASIARGYIADLHLHGHLAVVKMCWVPDPKSETGYRLLTIDEIGIMRQAAERDHITQSTFGRELEALGIGLDYYTDKKGVTRWHVKGSNPTARRFLSTNKERSEVIREELEIRYGRAVTDSEVRDEMRFTRMDKSPAAKEIDEKLSTELHSIALRKEGIELDFSEAFNNTQVRLPLGERYSLLSELLASDKGMNKDTSTLRPGDVFKHITRCSTTLGHNSLSYEELKQFESEFRQTLIPVLDEKGRSEVVSRSQIERELHIELGLRAMSDSALTVVPDTAAITAAEESLHVTLDNEQKEALVALCSDARVTFIEGDAGTGKTTLLKAAVDAHRRPGLKSPKSCNRVIVLAVASKRAIETGASVKADESLTFEALELALSTRMKPLDGRDFIIIDEAAVVDTVRMASLMTRIEALPENERPKLALVGDPNQATPVGAFGWYERQTQRLTPRRLTQVHRQKDVDGAEATIEVVNAYKDIRSGHAATALRTLQKRGRVHIAEDHQERVGMVFAHYSQHRDKGRGVDDIRIILDTSNRDVDLLNRFVQQDRITRGEISDKGFRVRATQDHRSWTLREGDSVMFLKNQKILEEKISVANGTMGTLVKLDAEKGFATVHLPSLDKTVTLILDATAETQVLGLAYAQHTTKFQGGEVPVVLAMPGPLKSTSLNSGYSQLTRAVEEAHLFADHQSHTSNTISDPIEGIGQAWARASRQLSALEALERSDPDLFKAITGLTPTSLSYAEQAIALNVQRRFEMANAMLSADIPRADVEWLVQAKNWTQLDEALQKLERPSAPAAQILVDAIKKQPWPKVTRDPVKVLLARLDEQHSTKRAEPDLQKLLAEAELAPGLDLAFDRV